MSSERMLLMHFVLWLMHFAMISIFLYHQKIELATLLRLLVIRWMMSRMIFMKLDMILTDSMFIRYTLLTSYIVLYHFIIALGHLDMYLLSLLHWL